MKAAFVQYDVNKDGNISMKELEDGMVQTGQFSFDEARQVKHNDFTRNTHEVL